MERVHKFFLLPAAERRVFLQALLLMMVLRLVLPWRPFMSVRRRVRRIADGIPRLRPRSVSRISTDSAGCDNKSSLAATPYSS